MFIRSQNNLVMDSRLHNDPYVKPVEKSWELCMDSKDGQSRMINIATFDSVSEANAALKSLIACIKNEDEVGWDANEYKENQETPDKL